VTPLVSAVVAVHNGEAFLEEALKSALTQDHPSLEIVVVDDGSTDGSAAVARALLGDHVISTECNGVGAARNLGLSMTTGAFVAFLDHDDVWEPSKTTRQVEYLRANPAVGCVLGRQEIFFEPGCEPPRWMSRDTVFGDLDGIPLVSAMFRVECIRAIGGYDPSYAVAEDRDLFVRLRESGCRIEVLPDVVLRRRFHDTNRSHQSHRNGHALLRSLKAKADRAQLRPGGSTDA
jgi:glycosyltransferase involved in cell wall biosynthesis